MDHTKQPKDFLGLENCRIKKQEIKWRVISQLYKLSTSYLYHPFILAPKQVRIFCYEHTQAKYGVTTFVKVYLIILLSSLSTVRCSFTYSFIA